MKDILPITLCIGDRNAQQENQLKNDSVWANNRQIATDSQ